MDYLLKIVIRKQLKNILLTDDYDLFLMKKCHLQGFLSCLYLQKKITSFTHERFRDLIRRVNFTFYKTKRPISLR